ncbi:MAG TPA: ribulokinase [Bryobacteraceae bacterium]|jgi:L-ribulokinase|nr:ribulokinase [Bryobacteraceae bacterium]
MAIVAGVDFGTLSVRVSIVDSEKGRLGSATAEYPLHRKRDDPDYATQSHADQLRALTEATRKALEMAGVSGDRVEAIALDTTGSSVIPVDANMAPLNDYYLWCDHRSWKEAGEITRTAHTAKLEAIDWCGGVYSSEWGWSKLLHWLRHNPEKRPQFATALENCDMIAAVLCGVADPSAISRSVCAMGHKWMFNDALGGLPPENFLAQVDPVLAGVRGKIGGRYATSDTLAGHLSPEWAEKLGLRAGIPIPVGAFDAHWDAVGSGIREGDVVNVVGTSTCIMAMAKDTGLIPGLCGVVKGSIHPDYFGIEAGLSATGDIFDAIARRAGTTVSTLAEGLEKYRAGQTGLMRLTWDNGDRTVLVNAELGGVTLGWNLTSTAQDELFAAMEGTAFHTRVILERMAEYGVRIDRVINAGGIPQRGDTLNRVYSNVLNKPVLVPAGDVTSLGSAIFAFLAAGTFQSIEDAQKALCPAWKTYEPDPREAAVYENLFAIFRKLYFGFGEGDFRDALPGLRAIARA